ncbi:SMI1/KNR4 family protein [Citrobacter sp. Awk 4]|uniref:SMI1/KNR4 family protein n=1 Tax=Citrobacter sp. Awk 4 TaxID=2963955 RepID=UPI0023043F54|nr:SMI1/KNR4 family protein [Citrobacter sp. Awk 4]MDA8481197.1 SMI1/KNR4 family protein [Citrobacter sp. Awk 4]
MTVRLINSSPSLTTNDLNKVEALLGIVFPPALRAMWLAHNGGVLDGERCVYQNDQYEFDIKYFLPVLHTKEEGILTVESLYGLLTYDKKILSETMVPFAIDGGGFPFCIDINNGAVYFTNLESQKTICLEQDLDSFISNVITEDEAWG